MEVKSEAFGPMGERIWMGAAMEMVTSVPSESGPRGVGGVPLLDALVDSFLSGRKMVSVQSVSLQFFIIVFLAYRVSRLYSSDASRTHPVLPAPYYTAPLGCAIHGPPGALPLLQQTGSSLTHILPYTE